MKYFISFLVTSMMVSIGTSMQATGVETIDDNHPIIINLGSRLETIDDHAFFIMNLRKEGISVNYGDKVVLVFGFNSRVNIYNISESNNNFYTNNNELVAFIDPEHLRCFQVKNLKKVVIYTGGEKLVIKTNIKANELKLK
jgi:hypothetical protein